MVAVDVLAWCGLGLETSGGSGAPTEGWLKLI